MKTLVACFILTAGLITVGLARSGAEEARYYRKLPDKQVQCLMCPRECILSEGQRGTCTVRRNVNGELQSLVYARPCSIHIDPIEKKPLFHFLPGSETFSLATAGCNLRCVFCQNWEISQTKPEDVQSEMFLPEQLVDGALERKCASISYTYSEPTVFYEYMFDSSALAHKRGIRNVLITSGYMNQEPLRNLCAVLDAANVDLKGFSDKTYQWMASAKLQPVLDTLKTLKEKGVWLEVGYLVIPTVNDSPQEIQAMVDWVAKNLGPDVPLHFLRFFPQHKLTNLPPTPIATLERAYETARKAGMHYVYLGNVPGHKANNTWCPQCGKLLIERTGFFTGENNIKNGRCRFCGRKIAGIWK